TSDKHIDPIFQNEEVLFRRFYAEGEEDDWRTPEVSVSIFPLRNDSYNRGKYSNLDDVLFNINAKNRDDHFFSWGILSIKVEVLKDIQEKVDIGEQINTYTFSCEHSPETCMYPHTEVHAYKDGEKINSI